MKNEYKTLYVILLMASLVSACGSSSVKEDRTGSVVEQKAERATTTAETRVDQHTDQKVNSVVDRLFRKL